MSDTLSETLPAPGEPAAPPLRVEVYADVVCPWCYIGKRRFAAAAERYRADGGQLEITWRPFQLDPEAPEQPQELRSSYIEKFGSEEKADEILEHVEAVAATEGLELDLEHAQRANTFAAHRVLHLALATGGNQLQDRVAERVMTAYFVEGRDINDPAVLTEAARAAGLTEVDVAAYLASDADVDEVKAAVGEGRAMGITSVPTFVFEGRWAVAGAQEPDTFLALLQQVELAVTTGGEAGGGCGDCSCGAGGCGG